MTGFSLSSGSSSFKITNAREKSTVSKLNTPCVQTELLAAFVVKELLWTWTGGYFPEDKLSLVVPLWVFPIELLILKVPKSSRQHMAESKLQL